MRRFLTALVRVLVRTFFRRIELVGVDNVPRDGGVIFAVNHPNGLVDPLFLLCYAPRPVSFLAKAPLFRYPLIGYFTRTFDSIPVYRKQDNVATSKNSETFDLARAILGRGGSIAIFPEGTTHSDPHLHELKTGAARIALGVGGAVVPTGIYYTAKQTFRSEALVVFGKPIAVPRAELDASFEPPREAAEALTAEIERGIGEVTLQADSHAALGLIVRAEEIFSAGDESLAGELELRRRFAEGYHYLNARDPERVKKLDSKIARLEAELGSARLDADELVARGGLREWTTLAALILLLPLIIAGVVIHWPAYRLIGVLAKHLARGEDELTATIKFVGALLFFPLTWIAVAALAGWRLGWPYAIVALVVTPLLGWVALRASEAIDELVALGRALRRRTFERRGFLRLVAQREAIREEILVIAEEMDARLP